MEIITKNGLRNSSKYIRFFVIITVFFIIVASITLAGILIYARVLGPPPLAVSQSTIYYSDDGSIIGESNNGQKRYWVSIENINPSLVDATVSIEDKNFFAHHGFDFKRIGGAVLADIKAMAKVQGASTITQQYARNLFLEHDKTWSRKLSEAFYTIRLEMFYSKEEILEGYLNTIYYGNGAYGSEAASQYYFGKSSADLTLAEATMLAGIPKGPSSYSPLVSLDKAKQRQKVILDSLVTNKYITKNQEESALNEQLSYIGKFPIASIKVAPYFQDAVKNVLKTELHIDDRTIALGGLRVYTTLNTQQQEIAEKTIHSVINPASDLQIGFVAMNPANGYVQAMVGGRNYEESPFNRAVQAKRQPGSTIKPLLYYAALEHGFTPTTMMSSEKTTFRFDNGSDPYTPHNFNNRYAEGNITLAQALALSDNVYAVKTHLFLGEDTLVETGKRFGIDTPLQEVPSLALGTSNVKVIEMANAYSILANGGKKVKPIYITRIETANGEVLYNHKQTAQRILDKDLTLVMNQLMTGMFDEKLNGYSSVTGSPIKKDITRIYAGKSGSTETDSWMIGYTPQLVSAVWTGYDQGKPITLTADKMYAKNVWVNFMEESLKDEPIKGFSPTKGTVGVYINPKSGKLATTACPTKRLMYFTKETVPTDYCSDLPKENNKSSNHHNGKTDKDTPWYKRILPW
ncbi:transglycosylase domain-containing protein [Niallia nealsonii]|uniref:Monofunctional biosynthetic peptidoglycan transglycosylase n=1 Tax=Niallia nealsonii TaxID=115979 RepID=A0A2N0YZA1_9BACI|nr:PBP1A family penicillin-binding protein [Niallia nealsonii]PKG22582.1 monofunctional biosynthetic peptidoglycan transglycosylase [Niallia nealsonii]